MGSIHGKIISSYSWNDNAPSSSSLCAAHDKIEIDCDIYCNVCDSISPVRDGLGSHKRAMHLKKHNLEDYAGRSNFWYHVLKKRVSDTCTRRMVSRPALKHSCDQCEPWFPFPGIFMNHKESSHEASEYGTLG